MTSYKSDLDFTNLLAYQVKDNLLSFWNLLVFIAATTLICSQIVLQSTPIAFLTTSQTNWSFIWMKRYLVAWISDALKLNWQWICDLICY